jgi:hypothetical protein
MGGLGAIDQDVSNTSPGRVPNQRWRLLEVFVSICLLGLAAAASWLLFGRTLPGPSSTTDSASDAQKIEADLRRICPEDPLLASRLATQWAYVAQRIGEQVGCAGLQTLDTFGDDAVCIFEKDRAAFQDLQAIVALDGSLYGASTGPWRKAVVEWAMTGRLRAYREFIERLGPPEREELRRNPSSLPLLGQDAPIAKKMLAKFGSRAWHLFMLLDFGEGGPGGVERVARCLAKHGEDMLDLNERYGLAVALLLVAPPDDPEERLPGLFRHAIGRLGVEEAAALFLTNYDDLATLLLKEARSFDEPTEVVDILSAQQPELRVFASDSGHTIRLLLEKRGNEHIGFRQ